MHLSLVIISLVLSTTSFHRGTAAIGTTTSDTVESTTSATLGRSTSRISPSAVPENLTTSTTSISPSKVPGNLTNTSTNILSSTVPGNVTTSPASISPSKAPGNLTNSSTSISPSTVPGTSPQAEIDCECRLYPLTTTDLGLSRSSSISTTQSNTDSHKTSAATATPTNSTTTAPLANLTTTAAPANLTTTVAPTNSTTTASSTNSTTTTASSTNSTTASPTNSTTTASSTNTTTTAAPTNSLTTASPTNLTVTVAPTNSTTTAAPTNSTRTATPTNSTTIASLTNSLTAAPLTNPKVTASLTNSTTTASPTYSLTTDSPTNATVTASRTNSSTATTATSTTTAAPTNATTTAKPITSAKVNASMNSPKSILSWKSYDVNKEKEKRLEKETVSKYVYCYNKCNNISNDEITTSMLTTTSPPTTTRYRIANLYGKTVGISLAVIVTGNYSEVVPKDVSSAEYKNFTETFKSVLVTFYNSNLGTRFKDIQIIEFSEGSIKVKYSLRVEAPINSKEANSTLNDLRNANWSSFQVKGILPSSYVLVNETLSDQDRSLSSVNILLPADDSICGVHDVLLWGNDGNAQCVFKCVQQKKDCGHGTCITTETGETKCQCPTDSMNVYYGETCKSTVNVNPPTKVPVTQSNELSKTEIIAIAAGTGGGLVLILFIALVCVCEKLKTARKKSNFYSGYSEDKEALHSENSRIENVPNLKKEYTNLEYQQDSDQMQMQRFEPEGKNVEHESRRQRETERDDQSYRKVSEPEVGNVLIYQPTHLKEPLDRQSGASKFDSDESRQHAYQMIDSETSYKIRRPTINQDQNIPYK